MKDSKARNYKMLDQSNKENLTGHIKHNSDEVVFDNSSSNVQTLTNRDHYLDVSCFEDLYDELKGEGSQREIM